METSNSNDNKSNNKTLVIILFALVGVLGGTTAYFGYQLSQKQDVITVLTEEKTKTTDEKTKLENQLKAQLARYDSLFAVNSDAQALLGDERGKVEDLLKKVSGLQANAGAMKKFKAEAEKLRKEQVDLLKQIKDLQDQNVDLTAANVTLHKDLTDTKTENAALGTENKRLNTTVDVGSRLRAYEVVSEGIKVSGSGKEKSTSKAKRSNKIRTCFTLLENAIAQKGNRTLYMVVKDPSGQVLATGNESTFTSSDGGTVVYSAKKEVDYDNGKAVDICMYFGKDDMPKGKYAIDVYCDGYAIGSSTCELK
jgi:cell division protein FtsB